MLPPIKEELQTSQVPHTTHSDYGLECDHGPLTSSSEEIEQIQHFTNNNSHNSSSHKTSISSNEKLCRLCDYMTFSNSALDRHYYTEHSQPRPTVKRQRPPVIKKVAQRYQQCTCKIIYDNLEELQDYYDRLYKDYAIENLYPSDCFIRENSISIPSECSEEWESQTFNSNENISSNNFESSELTNSISSNPVFPNNDENGETKETSNFTSCIKLKKKFKNKHQKKVNMNEIAKRKKKTKTKSDLNLLKNNDLNIQTKNENGALCNTDSLSSSNITVVQQLNEQNFILNPHKGLSVSLDGKVISSWYQCLYCSLVCNDKEVLVRHYKQDHKHSIFRELSHSKSSSCFSEETEFSNPKSSVNKSDIQEVKCAQAVKKLDLKNSWIKSFSSDFTQLKKHNNKKVKLDDEEFKCHQHWYQVMNHLDGIVKSKERNLSKELSTLSFEGNEPLTENEKLYQQLEMKNSHMETQNEMINKKIQNIYDELEENSPLSSANTSILSKLLDEKLENSIIFPLERVPSKNSLSSSHSWADLNSVTVNQHVKQQPFREVLKELKSEFKSRSQNDESQILKKLKRSDTGKDSLNDHSKMYQNKRTKSLKQLSKSKNKLSMDQLIENDDSSNIDLDLFAYPNSSSKNETHHKLIENHVINQNIKDTELKDMKTIADKVQFLNNLESKASDTNSLEDFNQINNNILETSQNRSQHNSTMNEVNTHWQYQPISNKDVENSIEERSGSKINTETKHHKIKSTKKSFHKSYISSSSLSITEKSAERQKVNEAQMPKQKPTIFSTSHMEDTFTNSLETKHKESVKKHLENINNNSDDDFLETSHNLSEKRGKLILSRDIQKIQQRFLPKQEIPIQNHVRNGHSFSFPRNSSLRTFQHLKRKLSLNSSGESSSTSDTSTSQTTTNKNTSSLKENRISSDISSIDKLCSMVNFLDVSSDISLTDSTFTNITPMDSVSHSDRELSSSIKNSKSNQSQKDLEANKNGANKWKQQRKYLKIILNENNQSKEENIDNIGGLFDCSECTENFQSRGSLNLHLVKTKHLLSCSICPYQCQGIRALEFHNFLKHNIPILAPL